MADLPEGHIPDDDKYQFRERAEGWVNSWTPLFKDDIKDNPRWVRTGEHSLAYVSSQHGKQVSFITPMSAIAQISAIL